MTNLLNNLNEILLMGPGPSTVSPTIYKALHQPTLGHLNPRFIKIMDTIKIQLQTLLNTKNELTVPMSGTGSAGMETCFVNLLEPNDNVLILINGVFGVRMQDVATRLGANVDSLEFSWGTPVIPEKVMLQLAEKKYDLVAVVHAETSTGVANPIEEIGSLVKQNGALFLVDAVTSMGGMPVEMDKWGIDAIYSGTQKCLSCPPGLSPVSFSKKAVDKLHKRKSKVPNWYLDLSMIANYWSGKTRVYHHTAPINMLYGLYQSLFDIIEEGVDSVHKRHKKYHDYLVNGLENIGLEMLVESSYRLPMLNAVKIPEGVNDADVRSALLNSYNIEIGGGLGVFAGKVWRIGLMGHSAYEPNVDKLIAALKKLI
jgi:alanine-glyoxylate transaminase / serine-glyoxylate transaminase / serine-pyruvate transaminase